MPDPTNEAVEALKGFAPCPTCRQYSHSIGQDQLADAFNHFQSMYAHPVRGHPMGHHFDEKTRGAAQVLMAAARASPAPIVSEEVSQEARDLIFESLYHLRVDERAERYHRRAEAFLAAQPPEVSGEDMDERAVAADPVEQGAAITWLQGKIEDTRARVEKCTKEAAFFRNHEHAHIWAPNAARWEANGKKAAENLMIYEALAAIVADRDEWRTQHENLLSVRQSDLRALSAPPAGDVASSVAWETDLLEDQASGVLPTPVDPAIVGKMRRIRRQP